MNISYDHKDWEYFQIQALRGKNFADEWPTIPEFLQYTVSRFAGNPAFTFFANGQRNSINYGQLAEYVEILAHRLHGLGLQPGDRVVISGKNSSAWGIAYLAIICAGCVAVPLDARQDSEFHQHLIEFTEAKMVFMDQDLLQKLKNDGYQKFLLHDRQEDLENIWDLIEKYKEHFNGDLLSLASLCSRDLAVLLTTSGTTGHEKVAMLSHANLTSNVLQCVYPGLQDIFPTDRIYLLLPMHHSYPMTAVFLESICHGSEIIFPRGMAVQQIMQDLKDAKVTVFMGIPLLFNKIIQGVLKKVQAQNLFKRAIFYLMLYISSISDYMRRPLGSKLFAKVLQAMGFDNIRILICGAGALMPEVGKKYRQLGLDFIQGYGLTEAAPIVTLNPAGTPEVRSVGKLLPWIEGRLEPSRELAEAPSPVSGYPVGELCIDGPNKMLGYYKNEQATQKVFTEDGFLRTGDMGYFDAKGYFYITGRCKNVIVSSGGKNIYPEEIEEQFQLYSDFEQVLIRGYKEGNTEKVELIIYPKLPDSVLSQIDTNAFLTNKEEKLRPFFDEALLERICNGVRQVNQKLLVYQRINRVRLVLIPLEVTTTQKIKRFLVEQRLASHNDGLMLDSKLW